LWKTLPPPHPQPRKMVAKVASPASNANPTVRNKPGADSSDPEQIAWLNKCVTEKTAAAVLAAEKAGKPLAPEFAAALREKTALTSGFPVYEVGAPAEAFFFCARFRSIFEFKPLNIPEPHNRTASPLCSTLLSWQAPYSVLPL
jgi:hypothetical protein